MIALIPPKKPAAHPGLSIRPARTALPALTASALPSRMHFGQRIAAAAMLAFMLANPAAALADPVLDKADGLLKQGRADAATAIYTQYLRQHPTSLAAEHALAEVALRRFDYAQARQILEKALAQHPDSAETAARLGRLYQMQINSPAGVRADNSRNYSALAAEHFKQALALGPNEPLVLSYVAEWTLQQGDMVNADKYLQQALTIDPGCIEALQGQTRFYIKAGDLRRGKDAALHALELDSSDARTYFLVAQLLALASQPIDAVKYAERSEQLDYGRMPERDYFLATQYEKMGELQKAIRYYENLTVYSPREASVWLKLGELYDRTNQAAKSLPAYRRAVALNPDIPKQMAEQARSNTRAERIDPALADWRKLLAIQPGDTALATEAFGDMGSLHTLYNFYKPEATHPDAARDLALVREALSRSPEVESLQLDALKIELAMRHGDLDSLRPKFEALRQARDPAVAGEALFLLGDYTAANEQLGAVDGRSAEEYARLGDRLLLIQELNYSRTFYQRAEELAPDPTLEAVIKRIDAKRKLAEQRVDEGNALFNAKDYAGALAKYEAAMRINRQWDNVYLRLGDTYQVQKQWKQAKTAYDTAIKLSPGLMNSPGFAKNYRKVAKKAAK